MPDPETWTLRRLANGILRRLSVARFRHRLPSFVSMGRNCEIDSTVRFMALSGAGIVIGDHVQIWRNGELCGPITIGDHCILNRDAYIRPHTTLGRHVGLSAFVKLITDSHAISASGRRWDAPVEYRPIVVEDYAWIGAGAIVLGGVTIGHGSVIGAGSVVRHDTEPDSLYAGNPARLIRLLGPLEARTPPD